MVDLNDDRLASNKESTGGGLAALRARVKKLRETGSTPAKDGDSVQSRKDLLDSTPSQLSSTRERQPSWVQVLESVDRHCYVKLDRAAYRHFEEASNQLREKPDSPERWLVLLNCLKSPSVKNQVPAGSVLRLYEYATRNLNLRENRRNRAYVKLWLSYANDQASESPDDSRDTFKYMRAHRIGEDAAELYETWAFFEAQNGNADKAKKLFEEAALRRPSENGFTIDTNKQRDDGKPPVAFNTVKVTDDSLTKKRGRTPVSARKPLLSTGPARRVKQGNETDDSTNEITSSKVDLVAQRTEAPATEGETIKSAPTSVNSHSTEKAVGQQASEPSQVPSGPVLDDITPSISNAVKRIRLTSAERRTKPDTWSSLWTTYDHENATKSSGTDSPELSRYSHNPTNEDGPNLDDEDQEEKEEESDDHEHHHYSENAEKRPLSDEIDMQRAAGKFAPPPASVFGSISDAVVYVNNKQFLRLEMVGRGGSSKVYKVMGPDRKIYALKRVRVAKKDLATISSYANEIKLLMRLRGKPHIVQLFDAEVREDAGIIHVVMEFGDIDLARLLSRGRGKPVNTNFLRLYWQQMLEAVHTIHEERIVHGDLKPANFLLVEGALKLIDFGIAKAIQSDDTTNIVRDTQVGTPNYMSPEALLCAPDGSAVQNPSDPNNRKKYKLGRASDIWSLGCILYQMVCGRTPFAHLSMIQKLHSITDPSYEIQFPSMRNQYILDDLRSCLQRDPLKRPSIPELLRSRFLCPDQRSNNVEGNAEIAMSSGSTPEVSRDMLSTILEQLRGMDVNIPTEALSDPTLVDKLLTRFRVGS